MGGNRPTVAAYVNYAYWSLESSRSIKIITKEFNIKNGSNMRELLRNINFIIYISLK